MFLDRSHRGSCRPHLSSPGLLEEQQVLLGVPTELPYEFLPDNRTFPGTEDQLRPQPAFRSAPETLPAPPETMSYLKVRSWFPAGQPILRPIHRSFWRPLEQA